MAVAHFGKYADALTYLIMLWCPHAKYKAGVRRKNCLGLTEIEEKHYLGDMVVQWLVQLHSKKVLGLNPFGVDLHLPTYPPTV